jgi:hypothetical protein
MLASLCSAVPAQDSIKTAAITIEVKDQSGGFIPNAQIQITPSPSNIGKSLTTDGDGRLRLELPPGNYDLTVASPGFAIMKKRVEAQNATPQLVSVLLAPGSCSGCYLNEAALGMSDRRTVSPDQRYAIAENENVMGEYTIFLEDRDLKTRRELFTYKKQSRFLWNPDSKVFAVTGCTGSDVFRCAILSVDEMVRPIPVLDLFARQLSEIEREDLEGRLTNRYVSVEALKWTTPTDLVLEVSGYSDADHAIFADTYTVPVDLHPKATAPIWPR